MGYSDSMITDISKQAKLLLDLKSKMNYVLEGLRIRGECLDVDINRHLAFFDVKLNTGTSIRKIENNVREIALGIRSKTIPIVKVLPDKGLVRLQVALKSADTVYFEDLYCNNLLSKDMLLPFLLGETEEGEKLIVDFAKNPHTIIAGGTGSGKSVLLHSIIGNALYLNAINARNIQLYLVDPKNVEFISYEKDVFKADVTSVIYEYQQTVHLLSHLENVMEDRYAKLASHGLRSVESCPRAFSQIVVIIDEVADLIVQDGKNGPLQRSIIRLAQKARAAGIYLILATQRPSVDIITGVIKANFPARIACKTASKTDSQVILDSPGAENLLGRGDAILNNMSHDKVRFQVAFSDPERIEETYKYFCSLKAA